MAEQVDMRAEEEAVKAKDMETFNLMVQVGLWRRNRQPSSLSRLFGGAEELPSLAGTFTKTALERGVRGGVLAADGLIDVAGDCYKVTSAQQVEATMRTLCELIHSWMMGIYLLGTVKEEVDLSPLRETILRLRTVVEKFKRRPCPICNNPECGHDDAGSVLVRAVDFADDLSK